MNTLTNPYRGNGLRHPDLADVPWPATDPARVQALLAHCPHAGETPLVRAPALAKGLGPGTLWIKDERGRMGLGSFKALGAAFVIACDAEAGEAKGRTYVTASAGNHGLSVAAGAAAFGACAVVFLSDTVPEAFADRLRAQGAEVARAGATYEASMAAAEEAASLNGWELLSDSSWPGYMARPLVLMEGYLALMAEVEQQVPAPPDWVFLQAGVGGLAGAAAARARSAWGAAPRIVVVEPEAAPALFGSIAKGAPVTTDGPVSAMGRLDCKTPSLIALKGLARDADHFVTVSESEGRRGAEMARAAGLATTPSGAAGLAGLAAHGAALGVAPDDNVLLILSEGPEA